MLTFVIALFSFSSCSDDDNNNRDNSRGLEYRVSVETVSNPILNVVYTDSDGNQVFVNPDDESITINGGMTTFSKTIEVDAPFEAQMTATLQNNSTIAVPFMISIAEDGVVAVSDNLSIPANSATFEANLSYALEVEE